MAIVGSAELVAGYPKGEFSLSSRKYTARWLIKTDDANDGPILVQSASGLPSANAFYQIGNDIDELAWMTSWTAEPQDKSRKIWIVEGIWQTAQEKSGSQDGNQGGGTYQNNPEAYETPLLEIPVCKFSYEQKEIPITWIYDVVSGTIKPPQNSACEVYNPPFMRKSNNLKLSITRNEDLTDFHPSLGNIYSNSVNSDFFWGVAPGFVMCDAILPEPQQKQIQGGTTINFLRVEYQFTFKSDGWDIKALDHGNYYCPNGAQAGDGSGSGSGSGSGLLGCPACTTKIAFLDEQGHARKGLLNGHGNKLPESSNPVYQILRPYNRMSFLALGLPNSLTGGVQ